MIEKKYFAPNLITAGNLLLGYLSILASMKGLYDLATYYILAAMVCDTLDGKTARKFDAFSEFGKEFDSFCDAISFGIAPAILVFTYIPTMGPMPFITKTGFITIISFVYALCGVMRLVKFNIITTASETKDDFSGMPIPCAAALIVSYYHLEQMFEKHKLNETILSKLDFFSSEVFLILALFAGLLMVSTIPFKTPDKVLTFIPKRLLPVIAIVVVLTFKYSLFFVTAYYVLFNIYHFLVAKYLHKDSSSN
ncbi:MAG: CDP-diacylglycerol--serine O-phosphatidyltransferase [Fusobacteriaceae bacterium]